MINKSAAKKQIKEIKRFVDRSVRKMKTTTLERLIESMNDFGDKDYVKSRAQKEIRDRKINPLLESRSLFTDDIELAEQMTQEVKRFEKALK
jgi:predicted oxidoreductase